jgi:hypothetical protein
MPQAGYSVLNNKNNIINETEALQWKKDIATNHTLSLDSGNNGES